MKLNSVYVCVVLSLTAIILSSIAFHRFEENFDVVHTAPPEWFRKTKYDVNDWFVYYEPDQISKPECTDYRGDQNELNWLSSNYRFWRM